MTVQVLVILIKILSTIIPLLIAVAYFTLVERKIIGSIQRRHGPNVIGFLGLFQPLADGLKLFAKEIIIPTNSNKFLFVVGPMLTFTLSLISWAVIPFSDKAVIADINLGIMYLLAISTMNVYGILISGWSSNSKYSLIGALRSSSQMLSYEISIGFILINVSLCSGSLNLTDIVNSQKNIWYIAPLFPMFVVFCVSMLAETNRHPFDLPEAEAELVSGYNVEYSGMFFGFFFLAEYINMLLMSSLLTILFLGGWLPIIDVYPFVLFPNCFWFNVKICFGVVFFIVTRASLPRYRYDQLMVLGWKIFLPLTIGYVLFTVSVLISFNWLPN